MHISDAKKSDTENRMLADKPSFSTEKGINLKYGMQYDDWFNDHFNGRETLISIHTGIQKRINHYLRNSTAIMDTRTNWCFSGDLRNSWHTDASAALEGLNALDKLARDNGDKFYVIIVPGKKDIYNQHHPFIKYFPEVMFGDEIEYIKQNAAFPVVYPLTELREAAQSDFLFFKTEHHWAEWGAYHGYRALMTEIKKDFPHVPIVSENDYDIFYDRRVRGDWARIFGPGHTYSALHVKMSEHKFLDTDYRYYTPKKELPVDVQYVSRYRTKHYKYNPKGKYRVLLTGTSMNENLLQFLPYSFRELKYYRLNNVIDVKSEDMFKIIRRYANDFKKYHPDIIILVITSDTGNMPQLKNITK